MKDSNGTILKIGDYVTDAKGVTWQLNNIGGVSMMVLKDKGRIIKTVVLRKAHLEECVKV